MGKLITFDEAPTDGTINFSVGHASRVAGAKTPGPQSGDSKGPRPLVGFKGQSPLPMKNAVTSKRLLVDQP